MADREPDQETEPRETRREAFRRRSSAAQRGARRAYSVPAFIAGGRGPYSAKGMLTAELIIGVGIVAIRAVADYEPQADGTMKGKIGHPKGQYGPLPVLAGLIMTFFLLSFLGQRGGTKAKVAVIAGGLIILVLAMKSMDEFEKVSATFGTFGKAKAPPGDWQTSGTQAGSPLTGGSSLNGSGDGGGSGDGSPVKPGRGHKCPAGYTYDPKLKLCIADVQPGPPET